MTSERRLVDVSWDGTADYLHFDSEGECLGLERTCDVEALLEQNKRFRNQGNRGYGATKEWRHIASIPPALLFKWAEEKGVDPAFMNTKEGFDEIVMRYIRDPDWKNLRVDK